MGKDISIVETVRRLGRHLPNSTKLVVRRRDAIGMPRIKIPAIPGIARTSFGLYVGGEAASGVVPGGIRRHFQS